MSGAYLVSLYQKALSLLLSAVLVLGCSGQLEGAPVENSQGLDSPPSTISSSSLSSGTSNPLSGKVQIPARLQVQDNIGVSLETDERLGDQVGPCSVGTADLATTLDHDGGCFVGWTLPGEWMEWKFSTNSDEKLDFILRAAGANAGIRTTGKRIALSLDSVEIGLVTIPSGDDFLFSDVFVPNVDVMTSEHVLRATFVDGGVELNYVDVIDHVPGASNSSSSSSSSSSGTAQPESLVIPARLQVQDNINTFVETDGREGAKSGPCSGGTADLQATTDNEGVCVVAFTLPGEWMEWEASSNSDSKFDFVTNLNYVDIVEHVPVGPSILRGNSHFDYDQDSDVALELALEVDHGRPYELSSVPPEPWVPCADAGEFRGAQEVRCVGVMANRMHFFDSLELDLSPMVNTSG